MKRKFIVILAVLSVLMLVFATSACTGNSQTGGGKETYTVRFNENYNNHVTKVDVDENGNVTLPADPQRVGYSFDGWYKDADATEAFTSTGITQNVSAFAKWSKTSPVVTLKYMNYSTPDGYFAVASDTAFSKPENPKYNDDETYAFVAWYTDVDCSVEYNFATPVTSDITLYAGWQKQKAVVTFNTNTVIGQDVITSYAVTIGEKLSKPADPQREHYEFNGWFTEQYGGEKIDFDQPITEDMNIYGQWKRSEYVVKFNVNGGTLTEEIPLSYVIKTGTSAQEVADEIASKTTYVGHVFAGWYARQQEDTDAEVAPTDIKLASLDAIESNMTAYAAWILDEYDVTFDINYQGAENPVKQTVKYNKIATEPQIAEREGYIFGGWFKDVELTKQFTFDMTVTETLSLHAKWIESSVAQTDVTVTFYTTTGGGKSEYAKKTIAFNGTAANDMPADPVVDDYYFLGWYEGETYETAFNPNRNLTADVDVYAKLAKKYTFEAEATNLEGKSGQGTSTNSFEEGLIMAGKFIAGGDVSNGYFIRELYYHDAELEFDVVAADAVPDAVIYLRVSSESYEFFTTKVDPKTGKTCNFLSDTEFGIYVNGVQLKYGGLMLPMANLVDKEDLCDNKTPFENLLVAVNVPLVKGENRIVLAVENDNNHGGTFHAEAPIIDCMYIYSTTELTMKDYEYYLKPNVNRG